MEINFISLSAMKQLATANGIVIDTTFKHDKIIINLKRYDGRKISKSQSFEFNNNNLSNLTYARLVMMITEFNLKF